MNILYARIDALCKEHNITVGKLCGEIGIRRSLMSDLKMCRKQTLSTETLSKLSVFFGVSIDYLIGNEEQEKLVAPQGNELGFDDFTYALHNETRKLTEENKQKLLEMAKFFQQQQELATQREKDKNN